MDVSLRRFGLRTGIHEAWTGFTRGAGQAQSLKD